MKWFCLIMATLGMAAAVGAFADGVPERDEPTVTVGFSLEIDCHDESIYLVVASSEPVDLVGLQVPLEWPVGMVPEYESLVEGWLVGFPGPPGEDLSDGNAIWTWMDYGVPLHVDGSGVEIARFDFGGIPEFISTVETGQGGIPAKAFQWGNGTITNLWDGKTDTYEFECWGSAPKP